MVDQLSMVSVWVLAEFYMLYCAHEWYEIFFGIYQLLYMPGGCLCASIVNNKIHFYLSEREKCIKTQKRYISWNTISSYIFENRVLLTFLRKLKGKTLFIWTFKLQKQVIFMRLPEFWCNSLNTSETLQFELLRLLNKVFKVKITPGYGI